MKDRFSNQSAAYRQFRPDYPQELYDFILQQHQGREKAWDCGTGNGQVAAVLADYFQEVEATDISENQLKNAITKPNVYYQLKGAEQTDFDDESFDLITVAQAVHWFDVEKFYEEAQRVAKPKAVLAIWGYGLLRCEADVNLLLDAFYSSTIGPYWDAERRFIDDEYKSIPFPFKEIEVPESFIIERYWTLVELEGYLNTWSAVQKYLQVHGENPVPAFIEKLQAIWKEGEKKEVRFPIFMRLGRM